MTRGLDKSSGLITEIIVLHEERQRSLGIINNRLDDNTIQPSPRCIFCHSDPGLRGNGPIIITDLRSYFGLIYGWPNAGSSSSPKTGACDRNWEEESIFEKPNRVEFPRGQTRKQSVAVLVSDIIAGTTGLNAMLEL